MVGLGLFSHCPCVLPYSSGDTMALVIGVVFGLTLSAFANVQGQKLASILPLMHALRGYVWLEPNLSLGKLEYYKQPSV